MAPSAAFTQAADGVLNYNKETPRDLQLQFYGLYKQTLQSPPIEETSRPGKFSIEGKYKWDAWKKVVDDGVTPAQAEKKYVELYNATKAKYHDPAKAKERAEKNKK